MMPIADFLLSNLQRANWRKMFDVFFKSNWNAICFVQLQFPLVKAKRRTNEHPHKARADSTIGREIYCRLHWIFAGLQPVGRTWISWCKKHRVWDFPVRNKTDFIAIAKAAPSTIQRTNSTEAQNDHIKWDATIIEQQWRRQFAILCSTFPAQIFELLSMLCKTISTVSETMNSPPTLNVKVYENN